jgi:hypothetical protein
VRAVLLRGVQDVDHLQGQPARVRRSGTGRHRPAGYLDLQRAVEDPRITNVSPYTKRLFVHHFRIRSAEEMDEEFAGWVREAYAVGAGEHLTRPA